ncbi:DUF4194 domain-containing protein [Deltaproteobacteria bacterium TL4]
MNQNSKEGTVKVLLFRGILYRDEAPEAWNDLLLFRGRILDWFYQVGLEVFVDEAEGYAFLKQRERYADDEVPMDLPPLIIRRPLSHGMSLLCVLLHKKLVEHEAHQSGSCVIHKKEVVEMMKVFMTDTKNEAKIVDDVNSNIKNAVTLLGFLRPLKGESDKYEIRRIIKAFVNAQNLADYREALMGVSEQEGENQYVC